MATPTYDLIASQILSTATASVTFAALPSTYRDLVIITSAISTGGERVIQLRFNSDSGTNYRVILLQGNGSSTLSSSGATSFITVGTIGSGSPTPSIINIMDYSATDKHKVVLSRANDAAFYTQARGGKWANNAAVTSIELYANSLQFAAGSSFHVYGIAS